MTHPQHFIGSSIAALSLSPLPGMAQQNQSWPGWNGPGPWHMMWGADGWAFWWIFPLMMFLVMVFICGFLMMRGPWWHRGRDADTTASAMKLLNERFAQGAISKDEYEEKRAILGRHA